MHSRDWQSSLQEGKQLEMPPGTTQVGQIPTLGQGTLFSPKKALFCKVAQTPGARGLFDLHRQQMTAPGVQGIPKQTLPWHLIQVTIPDLTVLL